MAQGDTERATEGEDERQKKLRHNTSADPESKGVEDLNPMEADSWSGGSINPEGKAVARGEAPANHGPDPDQPPSNSPPATPSSVTRPWSPEPEDQAADDDPSTPDADSDG